MICIRGAGKLGHRCKEILINSSNERMQICFCDSDFNKSSSDSEIIFSVEESVKKYLKGEIQAFIIPYEYQKDMKSDMINELLNNNIDASDILLFPPQTRITSCMTIDKLINLEVYYKFYPHFWEKYEKINLVNTDNDHQVDKENEYEIELVGRGWLYDYVSGIISPKNKSNNLKKVYIFCDNNTYNCRQLFNKNDNIYIFLFEYVMYFYYQNPVTYFSWCKNLNNKSSENIVTGISYIRDAFSSKKFLNLANTGQDLEHDFEMFKKYAEKKNDKNKNLVIGICPYSLRYSMKCSLVNQRQLLLYYPYTENIKLDEEYQHYYKWFKTQKSYIDFFINKFNYKKCFFEFFLPQSERVDYSNIIFDEKKLLKKEAERKKNNLIKTYNKPYNQTLLENKKILKEYVEYAIKCNYKVFFFMPPYTSFYKKMWKKEYLIETRDYLTILSKEYDANFIDLTQIFFPDYYFYDEGHLNSMGRNEISKIIKNYIK